MTITLRIAIAQVDMLVGDISGNQQRIVEQAVRARDELKAHAVVFPELALTGYPPEDLLLRPALLEQSQRGLAELAGKIHGIDVIVGLPDRQAGQLYNMAALLRDGRVAARYAKHVLPNYSVFDEKRYFEPGTEPCVVDIAGVPVGLVICEDLWQNGPCRLSRDAGAQLIIGLNASPFHAGKHEERLRAVRDRISETGGMPFIYANLVGGQDELVFDGDSFAVDARGTVTARLPAFSEALDVVAFAAGREEVESVNGNITPATGIEQSIYQALVLGVRDYINKNGFHGVVVGISGGIDSALTLAIAVDAIGCERVEAVMMPSRYTASMSQTDAEAECRALGVEYRVLSIEPVFNAFLDLLADEFSGLAADTTEENIQARCRGVILMAISNKKRKIVLTTGNKSEMSVGYATLYGDMAGGFAPIKDVPKTMVYRLARYRNLQGMVIPQRVIDRPPSAELAPDQKDTDSLPPYDTLDGILERYIELDQSPEKIIAAGFEAETVRKVVGLVDRNEYKRRQAPPGVRISRRAFGRDRRYPITSAYIEE